MFPSSLYVVHARMQAATSSFNSGVSICLFVEDMFEEYLHYVTVTYDCFRVLVGR